MAERLRVGVVGAGHFGRFHALKAASGPRTRLVGIADLDPARAAAVGKEAGAPALGYEALLAASDAVIVAAPAEAHFALAVPGAGRGQARAHREADRRHPRPGR